MKTETVTIINYDEFEDIVRKHYGFLENDRNAYSFVATQGCSNDSTHKFGSVVKKPLFDWDDKELIKFINREPNYASNYILIQDLVNQNVLEPGNYIVEVCW